MEQLVVVEGVGELVGVFDQSLLVHQPAAVEKHLGRVDVAPGAVTEFTSDPVPTANIEVSVKRCSESRAHAVHVELTPLDRGAQPAGWKLKQSFLIDWAHITARHISPGLWRLKVHAIECDMITRTIKVGQETQKVELELQRSTIR